MMRKTMRRTSGDMWRLAYLTFFVLSMICFLLMGFYMSKAVASLGWYHAIAVRFAFMGLAAMATMQVCKNEYDEQKAEEQLV
jgi:hypothetical protein